MQQSAPVGRGWRRLWRPVEGRRGESIACQSCDRRRSACRHAAPVGASQRPIIIGGSLSPPFRRRQCAALYYAKAYLIDRPALTVNLQVEQIGSTDESRYLLVTLAFANDGVRPYDLTLKELKPITIARVTKQLDGEPSLSAREADLAAERLSGRPPLIHDINGISLAPAREDKNAVATAVPEPGLYFVAFNAAVAYRSLIGEFLWNRIASATTGAELAVGQCYGYLSCAAGAARPKAKPRRRSPGPLWAIAGALGRGADP